MKVKPPKRNDLIVAGATFVDNQEEETIFFIRKFSIMEYELIEMKTKGIEVVSKKCLHKDIPGIVLGKFLEKLRNAKAGLPV